MGQNNPLISQLEPVYCKSTGAYLSQVCDFTSSVTSPKVPFKIVPAAGPSEVDALSWLEVLPDTTTVRIHPDAEIRENVNSIFTRSKVVSVVINRRCGSFVEFNTFDELNSGAVAIALIRHRLLEYFGAQPLHEHAHTNVFILETGCDSLSDGHKIIVRNRYSGRTFSLNNTHSMFSSGNKIKLVNPLPEVQVLFQKLCLGGVLRQICN